MSIYNRLLLHAPYLHLPGNRRIKKIRLTSTEHPLLVRLGTSDWYAMEEVLIYGEYAPLVRHILRAAIILDLGANVGMSLRLWQMTYPGAKIVAVEPDHANLEMAKRNVGSDDNIKFVQACVAARVRPVTLDRAHSEYAFRMAESGDDVNGGQQLIPALTVPEILKQANISGDVDLLKCDIEGAEAEVFDDCAAWIGRIRTLAVEVHEPYTVERLQDDLRRAGANLHLFDRHSKGGFETVFFSRSPETSA